MFRWLIYLLGEGGVHLPMQPLCVDAQLRTLELWPGLALSDEEFVGEQPFCGVRDVGLEFVGR